MDKPVDLKSIIERCLAKEVSNHDISVIPPSEISDNDRFYLILNISRPRQGSNVILRIEEKKRQYFFGQAPISPPIANLIYELMRNQYKAGNKPGTR